MPYSLHTCMLDWPPCRSWEDGTLELKSIRHMSSLLIWNGESGRKFVKMKRRTPFSRTLTCLEIWQDDFKFHSIMPSKLPSLISVHGLYIALWSCFEYWVIWYHHAWSCSQFLYMDPCSTGLWIHILAHTKCMTNCKVITILMLWERPAVYSTSIHRPAQFLHWRHAW